MSSAPPPIRESQSSRALPAILESDPALESALLEPEDLDGEATTDLTPLHSDRQKQRIKDAAARKLFKDNPYFQAARRAGAIDAFPVSDYLFLTQDDPHRPEQAFHRLRWGGQLVFLGAKADQVLELAKQYQQHGGFAIEQGPATVRALPRFLPLPLPFIGKRSHFFLARKTSLLPPGGITDRFTFDVQLARRKAPFNDYVVLKRVPPYYRIVERLRDKFPDAPPSVLLARAEKLVERVFPVFLTREAAFLQLLQRDLPLEYRGRVPRAIGVKKGPDGLVRTLFMNWMRMGHTPLTHMEFCKQSSDLLRVLHDGVRVIHLDLRLDNFVITESGVGFVDFGSAVRVGENLHESPMLRSLFDEMMTTSTIQRTMGKMRETGRLTSDHILSAYQKVDKAVDLFYLAVQLNRPHSNPDLRHLIQFDKQSEEARRIRLLSESVLRPKNPNRPSMIAAADLLRGLQQIEDKLREERKR
jgi:hypothetical protein